MLLLLLLPRGTCAAALPCVLNWELVPVLRRWNAPTGAASAAKLHLRLLEFIGSVERLLLAAPADAMAPAAPPPGPVPSRPLEVLRVGSAPAAAGCTACVEQEASRPDVFDCARVMSVRLRPFAEPQGLQVWHRS